MTNDPLVGDATTYERITIVATHGHILLVKVKEKINMKETKERIKDMHQSHVL